MLKKKTDFGGKKSLKNVLDEIPPKGYGYSRPDFLFFVVNLATSSGAVKGAGVSPPCPNQPAKPTPSRRTSTRGMAVSRHLFHSIKTKTHPLDGYLQTPRQYMVPRAFS